MLRVVVDTNVWISAALQDAGPPREVFTALRAERFAFVVSQPLLDELAEVLARPRFARYGVTPARAATFCTTIADAANDSVPVVGSVRACRDPDDDAVLETALTGEADLIVTGDGRLLADITAYAQRTGATVRGVRVAEFLALLADEP